MRLGEPAVVASVFGRSSCQWFDRDKHQATGCKESLVAAVLRLVTFPLKNHNPLARLLICFSRLLFHMFPATYQRDGG